MTDENAGDDHESESEDQEHEDEDHEDTEYEDGDTRGTTMTETTHRLYAVVLAVTVFFVSWAVVAAKPWATAKPDPRLAALAQREQRLRADAKLVQLVVDRRMAAYRAALTIRKAQIAEVAQHTVSQRSSQSTVAAAAAVRIVNLPPLTITRSS